MNRLILLVSLVWVSSVHAAPPVVSNLHAAQRAGTKFIDITYDVADPDSGSLTVQIEISANGGVTYDLPVKSLSGAVGPGVAPGTGRVLTWDAGKDWNGNWSPTCKARLWVHDGSTPVPPLGMVYVPNGTFLMGPDPGVEVTLTHGYFMDRTEVSAELWNSVRNWGLAHGYTDIDPGAYRAAGHPIQMVNWYDCLKWCNARSEKEGLVPCYYEDDAQTAVYRSGDRRLLATSVKWTSNGYRLPTEAEWERAARGGLYRKAYPWGDTIDGTMANFWSSGDPFESPDNNRSNSSVPRPTTPVGYYNGSQTPAGQDMANGYGLYDVAGNVWNWCWNNEGLWTAESTDPLGPSAISDVKVMRGGSWQQDVNQLRCDFHASFTTGVRWINMGMRPIRSL